MRAPMPILVISLADQHTRRKLVRESFARFGMAVEFVDAIDLRGVRDFSQFSIKRAWHGREHRALTGGEVGCYLSHRHVWQLVLDRGYDCALVLEDDMGLEAPLEALSDFARAKSQHFDFLKVRSLLLKRSGAFLPVATAEQWRIGLRPNGTFGAQGYFATQAGAKTALARTGGQHLLQPLDDELFGYPEQPYRVLELEQPILREMVDTTTIQGRERSQTLGFAQKLERTFFKKLLTLRKLRNLLWVYRYHNALKRQV